MARQPLVSILTSGIGLGIYIPALLIQRRLRDLGIDADVEVLEAYYTDDGRRRHLVNKQAFHADFALALMGHRMAGRLAHPFDDGAIEALLRRWTEEARRHFIVWSGFWLPLLDRYRQAAPFGLEIDRCRIDAQVSASFAPYEHLAAGSREIWLWSWEQKQTLFEVPATSLPPVPFADRSHRLVVHGGGWGLGSYRGRLTELQTTTWTCDYVIHDKAECSMRRPGDRAFLVEPSWNPWHSRHGRPCFPPVGEVGQAPVGLDDHILLDPIRHARAIVSKPGGGTLVDSLSTATPIVLLEPYGEAEASNGALWEHLGFAIPYASWRAQGFDPAVLERLHRNLLARRPGPSYPDEYGARLSA